MTNEELLQQAKDQVAKKEQCASWDSLLVFLNKFGGVHVIKRFLDRAALLAIQSAREEGAKEERSKQPWKGSMYQDKN